VGYRTSVLKVRVFGTQLFLVGAASVTDRLSIRDSFEVIRPVELELAS